MNIANSVTVLRVLLVPVVVLLYYAPLPYSEWLAAGTFAVASLTDWLDGYLARRLGLTSPFGAFLDPVADKLLVVSALVLIAATNPGPWFVLPIALIISREVFVSALREWMASVNQRDSVAVGYIGKVKTTVQMIAIIVLLAATPDWPRAVFIAGAVLLYLAALLSLWSMISYLRNALPVLRGD